MFENIIGQKRVVSSLKRDILGRSLPRSLLFYGDSFSGKMSTALELGRALNCEYGTADWSCNCRSCNLHRLLMHPSLLLLGPRYFIKEILAAADVFRRSEKLASRYFFIRSVRKLTRRFDPVIWEGEQEKLKGISGKLQHIEELLDMIQPGKELPHRDKLEKTIESIVEEAKLVTNLIPKNNIPISQLRNAFMWAHETSEQYKILIIENADVMQASSQNSLLKLLEEPPSGIYIVLTTTREDLIYPTLLSRLRKYKFYERTGNEIDIILERIFLEDKQKNDIPYKRLLEYFQSWGDINPRILRDNARLYLKNILDGKWSFNLDPSITKDRETALMFLKYLSDFIYSLYESKNINAEFQNRKITTLNDIFRKNYRYIDELNLKPSLVLKSLYYGMKEVL